MKVEKCPRCGKEVSIVKQLNWFGIRACHFKNISASGMCYIFAKMSKNEKTTIRRWNRWARRERKEGANQ